MLVRGFPFIYFNEKKVFTCTNFSTLVNQLKTTPEIGRIAPEINNNQIRELIYGNYRIIYRLEKKKISILTIRHGKQILPIDEIVR